MFRVTTQIEIDNNTPLLPGLYRIYWIRNGVPVIIKRVAGDDQSGLLYIGQTDLTLRQRLNQFRCSAFVQSTNHSAGYKYRTNPALNTMINPDELYVEVQPCVDSYQVETIELKKYSLMYGEVPPLNG